MELDVDLGYQLHESPNMRFTKEDYGQSIYPEIKVERPLEELGSQMSIEMI